LCDVVLLQYHTPCNISDYIFQEYLPQDEKDYGSRPDQKAESVKEAELLCELGIRKVYTLKIL
jgi:hypothetical protein